MPIGFKNDIICSYLSANANRITKTSREGWKQPEKGNTNRILRFITNSMFNREIT